MKYPLGHAAVLLALATVAGCGGASDGSEGLTRDEERQLDEAAAALDQTQAEFEAGIQQAEPPARSEADTAEEH